MRKQQKARRKQHHHHDNEQHEQQQPNPNEAAASSSTTTASSIMKEEDDGLNDEDVYYDDGLTDEEAANQWLDAWSQSITSIPVRSIHTRQGGASPGKKHVKKKKSSKSNMATLAPHPAKRQSKKAFLCCIAEEDSVVDSCTNSVLMMEHSNVSVSHDKDLEASSPGGSNTTKICLELDRIQELASVIMEEEYPHTTPGRTTPPKSTGNATLIYGNSARKQPSSRSVVEESELEEYQDVDGMGLDRIQDVELS